MNIGSAILPQIKRILADSRGRQLAAWLVSVGLALSVSAIGRRLQVEQAIIVQLGWLFIVDSAIFLAIYRDYPKQGIVLIVFMYFLEFAILGYFILSSASLGV